MGLLNSFVERFLSKYSEKAEPFGQSIEFGVNGLNNSDAMNKIKGGGQGFEKELVQFLKGDSILE